MPDIQFTNGMTHQEAPPDEAEDLRSATRAIFELLHMHEKRIDVAEEHARLAAQQVAELATSMQMLRREIPTLMAAGIKQAVSDPELWAAAGEAIHAQAQSAAGGWLFGGLKAAAVRLSWVAALAFSLYAVGGLTAVIAWFKTQHL